MTNFDFVKDLSKDELTELRDLILKEIDDGPPLKPLRITKKGKIEKSFGVQIIEVLGEGYYTVSFSDETEIRLRTKGILCSYSSVVGMFYGGGGKVYVRSYDIAQKLANAGFNVMLY